MIAAAAVDRSGMLQTDADGQPFVREETHVVAAGVGIPTVGVPGVGWDESRSGSGSSYAAPLVAGMLALATQRYPEASGNQLVQALIHTTNGSIHEPMYEPETGYGYGAAWPATLLQSDPTSYADENPLMDRPYGIPSAEQVADAVARESGASPEDAAPAPADEDAAAAPVQADPLGPLGPAGIAVSVGLVAVVVAGIITALVIVVRRKGPRRGATP
ncbi:S8 family serine peptidase [Microbacterium sp. zg.Y909]|uniref:S8 family serine peptidase n=1 Tax=Microbacterium sp. zg.Y909 TaxID=2969413 RepID=UPI00214AE329|nr:S8/S53 family peptidase [Microbacterium sp. zg.Y909]MCR2825925.1 S8/S53 family peptidase [Microbacterium sp. zg.Y909]